MHDATGRIGGRIGRIVPGCLLALGGAVAPALADATLRAEDLLISQQDAAPATEETGPDWSPRPWRVQAEPMLWYAGLQGTVRAPGSSSEPEIEDLELDDSNLEPAFEAMFRFEDDDGTIRLSGFAFSQDANSRADRAFRLGDLNIAQNEQFHSEISYSSIEATYAWTWLRYSSPSATYGTRGFDVRIDPFVGLRGYTMRFEASAAGGDVNERETWVDVIGGLRMEMEFSDEFSVDLTLDGGGMFLGDMTSGSANVLAGFQWRPNTRFGAQIGYRFLYAGVTDGDDDDETAFWGSLAGLYGSVVWRF